MTFETVYEFIGRWPRRQDLADDIDVVVDLVHKWAINNQIPQRYHLACFNAAKARGFDISDTHLMEIHAEKGAA